MRFWTLVAFILPLSALAAPVLVAQSIAKFDGFFQTQHEISIALSAVGQAQLHSPDTDRNLRDALNSTSSSLTALRSSKEFKAALAAASKAQNPAADDAKTIRDSLGATLAAFNDNLEIDTGPCDRNSTSRNSTETLCDDILAARDGIISAVAGAVVMTG